MKNKDEDGISTDCSTQWITDVLSYGAHSRLRSVIKTQKRYDSCRDADYCIRFCPKCRRTWETQPLGYDNRELVYFYTHVTGYGKKEEDCIDCKGG
tara:strand:- start:1694 stop:1981 length:288 start_codon:yes stop_codon:yes gene_type:complete